MERVYIYDEDFVFGFIKEMPAICSQGKTKEDVDFKINKYYEKFKK